jgi:hypothetical protein
MKLKSSLEPRLLPVADVARLMNRAPDKRTLLSWKLGFHYHISSAEAAHITADSFSRDANGLPCGLFLRGKGSTAESGWYIPIKPQDRALVSMLLPESGPLFPADPFKKLRLLAQSGGIRLTASSLKESCLAYARASGLYHPAALPLAGIPAGALHRKRSRTLSRRRARQFWKLTPELGRVRCLPWKAPARSKRRARA